MRYFYKEGFYNQKSSRHVYWLVQNWTYTGKVIEVTKKFYYENLLPLEEKIVLDSGLKEWHGPFKTKAVDHLVIKRSL